MLIAVYGTLKQGHGNHRLLHHATYVGTGYISGHRLYQRGIPYVVEDPESTYRVQVEVYDVTPDILADVDSLEGHPRWYKRTPTDVDLGEAILSAGVYKLPEAPGGTTENTSGVY